MQIADILQKNRDWLFSDAVCLYARRGEITWQQAVGVAVTRRFDVASITKVCATMLAVMQLLESDSVALEAPAATLVPALRTPDKQRITIRQLLTHTSGLPAWYPLYSLTCVRADVPAAIAALPLQSVPGTRRCYSDLGFMLLGFVVEAVTHQRLDAYCSDHLYRPLGLTTIGFAPLRPSDLCVPTSRGNPYEQQLAAALPQVTPFSGWRTHLLCGEANDGNAHHVLHGVAGHAGLFATAQDLYVLLQLLLEGGSCRGVRLLQPATIDLMLTPDARGQGLGWWMAERLLGVSPWPPDGFGHFGFTGCFVGASRTTQQVLILLTNRQQMGLGRDGKYPDLKPMVSELLRSIQDERGAA